MSIRTRKIMKMKVQPINGWESARSVVEEREAKGRDAAAEQGCHDGVPSDLLQPQGKYIGTQAAGWRRQSCPRKTAAWQCTSTSGTEEQDLATRLPVQRDPPAEGETCHLGEPVDDLQ